MTELRELAPQVLSVLVRRGADFATAEDAVQEALIRAVATWPESPPADPKGWLITVAWRVFLDLARSDSSRRDREARFDGELPVGAVPSADDTLQLYFLCAHPALTPSSAVALTLRAVGGLTTRQIAQAYLVPESTMAQRISRAKRTVASVGLDQPGDGARATAVAAVPPAGRRQLHAGSRGSSRASGSGPSPCTAAPSWSRCRCPASPRSRRFPTSRPAAR